MDQLEFNASLKLLGVVGEEVGKIDDDLLQLSPKIPWRSIKGLRNLLVHDYRGIDGEIIFSIIKEELPALKESMNVFFESIRNDFNDGEIKTILNSEYYRHL